MMINFIKFSKKGSYLSIFFILLSFFLIWQQKINFGIDFTGGVLIEIKCETAPTKDEIKAIITSFENNNEKAIIQTDAKNGIIIKLQTSNENIKDKVENAKILIDQNFHNYSYEKIDFIGAQIGSEFFKKACLAIIFALIGIMIYLYFRFDLRFSIAGIIALIHDVILTFGFIALTQIEFNLITVTAILTVIGYSINDSVIIFDRIREIIKINQNYEIEQNVNISLNNTLSRTIFTSVTTLIAASVLIIFGGKALYSFSYVVFFGVLIGTYSSIIIASQMIILLSRKRFCLKLRSN